MWDTLGRSPKHAIVVNLIELLYSNPLFCEKRHKLLSRSIVDLQGHAVRFYSI